MAKGVLLKLAGVASFAIALTTPWQFENDVLDFVSELAGAGLSSGVATLIERPALDRPHAAWAPEAAPNTEPAPEPARAPWTAVVVTMAPRSDEQPARTPAGWSQKIAVPRDRAGLGLELQRELRRVGCYDGELHGVWTPATRRAMAAFTERINALLPTEEPDHILLALLRGHEARACGVACPAAQVLATDGRCMPAAILAGKKGLPTARAVSPPARSAGPSVGWASATRVEAAAQAPSPQRPPMGLAGPLAPNAYPADNTVLTPGAAGGEVPATTPASPSRPANAATRPPLKQAFGPAYFKQFDRSGF